MCPSHAEGDCVSDSLKAVKTTTAPILENNKYDKDLLNIKSNCTIFYFLYMINLFIYDLENTF